MILKETTLLDDLKQLKINLFVLSTKSEHRQKIFLTTFFATITEIFNTPGLFLFLQKVIIKAMQIANKFVNKIGGQYAKTFQEIIHKLVEKNYNYLFGSILYESIKKMKIIQIPKLDKKKKETSNTEILKNILEDKQMLLRNYRQQISQNKKLTFDLFQTKRIYKNDSELRDFQQVLTVADIKKYANLIEDQLKRKMVAVLNEGGGYLFLADRRVDWLRGVKEEDLFEYKQKIVKYKQEFIFPNNFELQFEILDLQSKNGKKIIHEKVLKITLFPKDYLLYFVSQQKKMDTKATLQNFSAKFLKYQDYFSQKTHILGKHFQNCQLMVKLYDAYKKFFKKKKGLSMIEPKQISDKIILNNKLRKQIIQGPGKKLMKNEQEQNQNLQMKNKKIQKEIFLMKDDAIELKLIYRNQSIFMINQHEPKLFEKFKKNLDSKKILYVASLPFNLYRSKSSKLIAVIDHQDKFQDVYTIAKKTAGEKLDGLIIVQPFVVIIEVSKEKFIEYQNVFKEKYGLALKPSIQQQQQQKGNDTYNVYLQFKGKQKSIFTFIFMVGQGLRTQFLKKTEFQKFVKNL